MDSFAKFLSINGLKKKDIASYTLEELNVG